MHLECPEYRRFLTRWVRTGGVMSARMRNADSAWLHMDRPTNLMVVTSVLWFDEPVDLERSMEGTNFVYDHYNYGAILSRFNPNEFLVIEFDYANGVTDWTTSDFSYKSPM